MQSTAPCPDAKAETPIPAAPSACASGPRKRGKGVMSEVRFVPLFWVAQAINDGLLPNSRACLVALAIAGAVDPDGRWCFLHRDTVIQRCGSHVSTSTVSRALHDLEEAGVIRRLPRHRVRDFFAKDVEARIRAADRLPDVVELMIPASAFPERALEKINEVRARLGEEPLDTNTRPHPTAGTTGHFEPPTRHIDAPDPSDRPTDLSVTDSFLSDSSPSVRAREPQGETVAAKAADHPTAPQLARIPDAVLRDPRADRIALERAACRVLDEGLTPGELTTVLGDATSARRPFPALMRRLRSPEDARAYLDGRLGQGIDRRQPPPPPAPAIPGPRPDTEVSQPPPARDPDPSAHPSAFVLDRFGRAARTCPDHPGIRNAPGGTCRACDRPCRTVPDEVMPTPVSRRGTRRRTRASHGVTAPPLLL
ncbi:hypothetical protein [Nocardiopsis lucentensis]|uniref:hypothetical protein n=1 Tax=Nocardiopsis lucentensis TaxID=53441 RepID=UPI00034D63D6|nr:hypothetical protein [Nocardiopsis lucentensis]